MSKDRLVGIRVSQEQLDFLQRISQENGHISVSEYAREILLKNAPQEINTSQRDFRYIRLQSRTFRCDQAILDEVTKEIENKKSFSQFIREAILEKLGRS